MLATGAPGHTEFCHADSGMLVGMFQRFLFQACWVSLLPMPTGQCFAGCAQFSVDLVSKIRNGVNVWLASAMALSICMLLLHLSHAAPCEWVHAGQSPLGSEPSQRGASALGAAWAAFGTGAVSVHGLQCGAASALGSPCRAGWCRPVPCCTLHSSSLTRE